MTFSSNLTVALYWPVTIFQEITRNIEKVPVTNPKNEIVPALSNARGQEKHSLQAASDSQEFPGKFFRQKLRDS